MEYYIVFGILKFSFNKMHLEIIYKNNLKYKTAKIIQITF